LKGPDNQQEERALIEAAQQDASRFGELYELHFERVYAYIARRVRERSAAEELTSHVFHQALANLGKFKWRGAPFAAWLFRIARNSIADRAQSLLREYQEEGLQFSRLTAALRLVSTMISNRLKPSRGSTSWWINFPGTSVT